MQVLVFGGTRFMGRYLARTLRAAGHLVVLANRGTRSPEPEVENLVCDRAIPGALDALAARHFDVVVDFSAYDSQWVAEAAARFAGRIQRYLFVSSCAVYTESQQFPLTEGMPVGPPHLHRDYAAQKILSERLLRDFSQRGAFQAVACRLPFVLGPENYEDRESFVFSRLHAGRPILLTNGGNALYSFVYAGDVALALLTLMAAGDAVDGQAFNIVLPQATTARGFVEACAAVAGLPADMRTVPLSDLGYAMQDFDLHNLSFPFPHFHFYASAEKLRQATGFEAGTGLAEILRRYHAWWLAQGALAPRLYAREQDLLQRVVPARA
jgi:nucleoside-diphosphate-sugar epimerase